jgi:hypothetical protein
MNARVFPLPVLAAPRTSLPFKMWGMDLAWISVAFLKPSWSIAFMVDSLSGKSLNSTAEKYSWKVKSYRNLTVRRVDCISIFIQFYIILSICFHHLFLYFLIAFCIMLFFFPFL